MNTRDRDAILKNTRHKYGVGGCEKLNTVSNGVLAGRDGFAISFRERERERAVLDSKPSRHSYFSVHGDS